MTHRVLFKDALLHSNKMNKCTIRLLRKNNEKDDVIQIYDDADFEEMYRINFRANDLKKTSEFYLDHGRTMSYISVILKSLSLDVDPFEQVQVETAMHPAVLYHISDLDDREVRHLIEDIVDTALRRPIEAIKRKD